MQEALSKVLATNGFMDYRRTLDYAHRVRAAIAQLHAVLQRDPVEGRGLCEYALKRLFKLIERVDDSSGAVGDCMAEIAHLHAQACTAAPPGKALAKTLWLMQEQEQWGLLPIAGYWEALGAAGQAAYAKLVVDAFEQLPPVKTERWDSDGFHACRLAEDLARCTGDFELLQRVLRRDLSSPHHHLCVLKSLQEFGRTREALVFAEAAVKRFPKDATLRNALAQCLAEAGLDEDALEQRWAAFLHQPDGSTWDAIKQSAGAHWPQWRAKALAQVTEATDAPASVRLQLLAHDGALDEAIALARSKPADMFSLQQLASRVRSVDPQAASEFYLRVAKVSAERLDGPSRYEAVVALLLQAQRCAPSQALEAFTAAIRQQHARKTKLLAMLDQAGL
jgi:tetratricopeptide (TPR) repeat protein